MLFYTQFVNFVLLILIHQLHVHCTCLNCGLKCFCMCFSHYSYFNLLFSFCSCNPSFIRCIKPNSSKVCYNTFNLKYNIKLFPAAQSILITCHLHKFRDVTDFFVQCVVPENIHTPQGRFFVLNPPPPPPSPSINNPLEITV